MLIMWVECQLKEYQLRYITHFPNHIKHRLYWNEKLQEGEITTNVGEDKSLTSDSPVLNQEHHTAGNRRPVNT